MSAVSNRDFFAFIRELMRSQFGWMLLAMSIAVLTILANVGLMGVSAFLIASSALHPPLYTLMLSVTGVRFFGISKGALRYAERYLAHDATLRMLSNLRIQIYATLEPLVPQIYAKQRNSDFFFLLVHDVETLQNFFVRILLPFFAMVFVPAVTGLYLYFQDTTILVQYLIAYPAAALTVFLLFRLSGRRIYQVVEIKKRRYHEDLWDGLLAVRDIFSYGQEARVMNQLRSSQTEYALSLQKQQMTEHGIGQISQAMIHLILLAFLYSAILAVAWRGMDGRLLPVVFFVILSSFEAMLGWLPSLPHLVQVKGAAERVLLQKKMALVPESGDCLPEDYSIHFSDLTFGYPESDRSVLSALHLRIAAGETVAILGHSGAGKSSLLHLLMGFYEAQHGEISIGGCPVAQIAARRSDFFSYVGEWNYLFHDTLYENFLLAAPQASVSDVEALLREVGLGQWLSEQPDGVHTLISEDSLSGGQKRRLFLAQAILHNAPIWLLDEPAAGLDLESEQLLLRLLQTKLQNKTAILITHHASLLSVAHRAFRLDQGKLHPISAAGDETPKVVLAIE